MAAPLEARWRAAVALITATRDIIDERPRAAPPTWAERRGWTAWLAALDPAALAACERDGLARHCAELGAPPDLVDLARQATAVARLPSLDPPPLPGPGHRVSRRKRAQVAAFAGLVDAWSPPVARVVDIGAGHGHLTRHLAQALGVGGLGLDNAPDRVATANRLAGAEFATVDLFATAPALRADDLVVGLHACGALSDRLLDVACAAGAAVAVIGCCLHKIPTATRPPRVPAETDAVALPRACLGLANINRGAQGVESSLADNLRARARRAGLRWLLRQRGLALREGEEMHGVNRRRAHDPLPDLAARVLAHRGLAPATPAELAAAERAGIAESEAIRRWSIARRLLGRPLEVYLALDRALSLARAGYRVRLGTVWPAAISPRNIAILGAPPG